MKRPNPRRSVGAVFKRHGKNPVKWHARKKKVTVRFEGPLDFETRNDKFDSNCRHIGTNGQAP